MAQTSAGLGPIQAVVASGRSSSTDRFRRGRLTNSPPQCRQTLRPLAAHCGQNVHSNEQIYASASADSRHAHFSQLDFIANDQGNALRDSYLTLFPIREDSSSCSILIESCR